MADKETKQHLNLSERARTVLDTDRMNWMQEKEIPFSAMITQIVRNYYEESTASISLRCVEYAEQLCAALETKEISPVVEKLVKVREGELLDRVAEYLARKGPVQKINVCKGLDEVLSRVEDSDIARFFGGKRCKYLKAVLEEYATLSVGKREEIYFKDKLLEIERAIERKRQVRVQMVKSNTEYYVKPYKVIKDDYAGYNYLIGYAQRIEKNEPDGNEQVLGLRVCRLACVNCYSSRSGVITQAERETLEEEIKKRTPQFMPRAAEEILVRLTPTGEENLKKQLLLRPQKYERVQTLCTPEYAYYRVDCTELQAQIYFSKFFEDAVILSPEGLGQRMRQRYEAAAQAYRELDGQEKKHPLTVEERK